MSVPHLDTRMLDGKRVLLFGPFATFSSKFLKNGSLFDLMHSLSTSNLMPMTHVGLDNFDLVKYLVGQLMMNDDDRFAALKEYFPDAKQEDWKLWTQASAYGSSRKTQIKAACCSSAPKSSALKTAASPLCWALHRALPPLRQSCCT